MSSTLTDIRQDWERGSVISIEFPIDESSLFVLVRFRGEQYQLLRYFKMGNGWEVSCDESPHDQGELALQDCLNKMAQIMTKLVAPTFRKTIKKSRQKIERWEPTAD